MARFDTPRLPDWQKRLNAFIAENAERPFSWGEWDCALFACGAVLEMTGRHPAPEFIGAYDSQRGAAEALRRLGAGTLDATFDAHFESKPPSFAQRGDLVMAHGAIGVCMGSFALFVGGLETPEASAEGLFRVSRSEFTRAWAVPYE